MAKRRFPLVNDHYYHIFNRGVEHRPTFTSKKEYSRALFSMNYYKFSDLPIKYSYFVKQSAIRRMELLKELEMKHKKLVDIICYCFMSNHFHFLLKQNFDKGISKFMGDYQNSYTKYFNTKNERDGSLFGGNFKSVLVETDSQFLQVSRYIHLNPYASSLVSSFDDLLTYKWSSLPEYLELVKSNYCARDVILSQFNKITENYKKFVLDHADYQRKLKNIQYLTLD